MEVFRLTRQKFADSLSGKGAALKGARWNSMGIEMIYSAANRSLAMAEIAVHMTLATLPDDYVMVTIFIPDDIAIKKIDVSSLPDKWNVFPHYKSSQKIGDDFIIENKYCILQVPSSVTQDDVNFLLNPHHKDFNRIEIIEKVKFPFDRRIFK